MDTITLEKKNNQFVIMMSEGYLKQDAIIRLIDRMRWEHLIEKSDFDESIEELGEEIKADWWVKNRERILNHIV